MNQVGIWINRSKPDTQIIASQLVHWFNSRDWKVYTEWESIIKAKVNFLIALGGDGTLLEAAREAAPYGIPVLGVNFGRLGFLCEIERDDIYTALSKVIKGEYKVQERLMLQASIKRTDGLEPKNFIVLNDVVFQRNLNDSLVTLQASISGEASVRYPADGLIVATPTGSTAYSLSAGGPIVSPDVQAIILTPLAAHSLSSRPMVVSHLEEIEILLARGKECQVTFDGQETIVLKPGETVKITLAPLKALLIRLGSRSFQKVVREKLRDRWHD